MTLSLIFFFLQAVFREDMLRRDIEDLQKRYQVCCISYSVLLLVLPTTLDLGTGKHKGKILETISLSSFIYILVIVVL